jgi:hypothetical protein
VESDTQQQAAEIKAGSANEKGPMDDVLGQLELAGGKQLG